MPRKAHTLTDEERAKRIRETAEEIGASNNPKDFERAFEKVVRSKLPRRGSKSLKKT
jgi:hypothetical protein